MTPIKYILIAVFLLGWVKAQSPLDLLNREQSSVNPVSGLGSLSDLNTSLGGKLPAGNAVPVNEHTYRVDSGDQFLIKVDPRGPAVKVYPSTVTPDGYLTFPDAPSVKVRGKYLVEVKNNVKKHLHKQFPDAHVEVFLLGVHPVQVEVTGFTPFRGMVTLQSADRLSAIPGLIHNHIQAAEDTLNIWQRISRRRILLRRAGKTRVYDLMRFEYLGDSTQNPYVRHGDVVRFFATDSLYGQLQISGAVYEPQIFEYRPGDQLKDLIRFSGGLLPAADSNRIELVRYDKRTRNLKRRMLSYPTDESTPLHADDRIYVRYKAQKQPKREVLVKGAVVYPGFYAIEEGRTTLSDIIKQAGGVTGEADLTSARLMRMRLMENDKEYRRLRETNTQYLNNIEKSYLRLSTRQLPVVVAADFSGLLNDDQKSQDVMLVDQDIIVVPTRTRSVVVKGAVEFPGTYPYVPGWTYERYIEQAGGYADRARRFDVKIIKYTTGNWLDADEEIPVTENDVLFVPQRENFDWYEFIKVGIPIAAQIATVVLLFRR